jgi:hypothetical protein
MQVWTELTANRKNDFGIGLRSAFVDYFDGPSVSRKSVWPGADVMFTIFLRFAPIFGVFSQKTKIMIKFLWEMAVVCAKNRQFLANYFSENIF